MAEPSLWNTEKEDTDKNYDVATTRTIAGTSRPTGAADGTTSTDPSIPTSTRTCQAKLEKNPQAPFRKMKVFVKKRSRCHQMPGHVRGKTMGMVPVPVHLPNHNVTSSQKPKCGLPNFSKQKRQPQPQQKSNEHTHEEEYPTLVALDEMPCDTLLAVRSLISSGACLQFPYFCPQLRHQQQHHPHQQQQNSFIGSVLPVDAVAVEAPSIVLESQLYALLKGTDENGRDSVVARELSMLLSSNAIRRYSMPCASSNNTTANNNNNNNGSSSILMETNHYVCAIWDAYHYYQQQQQQSSLPSSAIGSTPRAKEQPPYTNTEKEPPIERIITAWFVSSLPQWTGRTISSCVLHESWNAHYTKLISPKSQLLQLDSNINSISISASKVVDLLVQMQVLLPTNTTTSSSCGANATMTTTLSYSFWLPHLGRSVLKWLEQGRTRVIAKLRRSYQSELSQSYLESQFYKGGLSGRFLVHFLVSQGVVELRMTPAGAFCKLTAV